MALSESRCPECGPFDLHREVREARAAAPCRACDQSTQRCHGVGVGRATTGVLLDAVRRLPGGGHRD